MEARFGNFRFQVEGNSLVFVDDDKDICAVIVTDNAKDYWIKITNRYQENLSQLEKDILDMYDERDTINFGKVVQNGADLYVMNPAKEQLDMLIQTLEQ